MRRPQARRGIQDGICREIEEVDTGFSGHPTMVGALGLVPPTGKVDKATMQRTLDFVMQKWPRDDMWGGDFPMMAMCACRLDRPDLALECLLLDAGKNSYLPNGHNYQQAILGKACSRFPEGWVIKSEGLLPGL